MATAGSVLVFRLDGTPRSFRRFVSWVFVRLHPNEFEADPKDPFKHDKLSRRHHVEAFCSVLSGIELSALRSTARSRLLVPITSPPTVPVVNVEDPVLDVPVDE